jgi:hypothetical protein
MFDTLKSLGIPLLLLTESVQDATSQSSTTVMTEVAEQLHGKLFVMTTHDATFAGEEQSQAPFIVILNSLDETKPMYEGKLETGSVLAFAQKAASTPVIGRLDLRAYMDYTKVRLIENRPYQSFFLSFCPLTETSVWITPRVHPFRD